MSNIISIVQLIANLYGALAPLLQQALAAHATDDQATLDTILAKAQAAADALAPISAPSSGAAPAG
jgi:hypothetical protein